MLWRRQHGNVLIRSSSVWLVSRRCGTGIAGGVACKLMFVVLVRWKKVKKKGLKNKKPPGFAAAAVGMGRVLQLLARFPLIRLGEIKPKIKRLRTCCMSFNAHSPRVVLQAACTNLNRKTTLVHQRMGSDHRVLMRVSCLRGCARGNSHRPTSAGRAATKTGCGRALEAPPALATAALLIRVDEQQRLAQRAPGQQLKLVKVLGFAGWRSSRPLSGETDWPSSTAPAGTPQTHYRVCHPEPSPSAAAGALATP